MRLIVPGDSVAPCVKPLGDAFAGCAAVGECIECAALIGGFCERESFELTMNLNQGIADLAQQADADWLII